MAKIGAREMPAGVALAAFLDGAWIVGIGRPTNVEFPGMGEQGSVARVPGGQYAVEQVESQRNVPHQLLGHPHAHQIAWTGFRKKLYGVRGQLLRQTRVFAHTQAADGITGEVEANERARTLLSQIGKSPPLHDAK